MSRQLMTSFVWAMSLLTGTIVWIANASELGVKKAVGMGLLVWVFILAVGYIGRALFWKGEDKDEEEM